MFLLIKNQAVVLLYCCGWQKLATLNLSDIAHNKIELVGIHLGIHNDALNCIIYHLMMMISDPDCIKRNYKIYRYTQFLHYMVISAKKLVFFDRSTCSKRSKESLFSVKKKLPRAIYSILAYFTMFSFRVLTCSRIVSIRIILILNKFRQV